MKFDLTARLLVGGFSLVMLSACTSKAQRIETSLRKGDQYLAQYEWDKASIEARNVLQMDPKNAGAYLLVAHISDAKGDLRGAFAAYQKVLELKPGTSEASLGVARQYLLAHEFDRAKPLVEQLVAQDPGNPRIQVMHVALQAGLSHPDLALAEAQKVLSGNTSLPADAALMLAGSLHGANQDEQAQAAVDRGIAAEPGNLELYRMGATFAALSAQSDSLQRANVLFAKAVQLAPGEDRLWNEWAAMYLLKAHDVDKAERVLKDAVQAQPSSGTRRVELLRFISANRNRQTAEAAWRQAIDDHSHEGELRLGFAEYLHAAGRLDDEAKVLQDVIDQWSGKPVGITAQGRMAELLLTRHERDKALDLVNVVLKANPRDSKGLVLRGRIERANGDPQAAIVDLRAALKDNPGDDRIGALLAGAHHQAGEHQLAREVLADLVKFNTKDPAAHLLLANDMMRTQEWSAADAELDAAQAVAPADFEVNRMKVELRLRKKDLAGAETVARALVQRVPNDVPPHMLLARTLGLAGKTDAALTEYGVAEKLAGGKSLDPEAAAVALLIASHHVDEARRRIDKLDQANPGSVAVKEMKGEVALVSGDLSGAEAVFQDLVRAPNAPTSAYRNLAVVKARQHDIDGLVAVLKQGEQANPQDESLIGARAEWLARAGRVDESIAAYDEMLKRFPDTDTAANNLAFTLAEVKRDPASLERAAKLAQRFRHSGQPSFMDTLGLVDYRQGHYAEAVTIFKQAMDLNPADLTIQMHYGLALVKSGNVADGTPLLRKLIAVKPALADHDEALNLVGPG